MTVQFGAWAETTSDRVAVAALVQAAAAGDRCAWDALVDRFAAIVWAIARAHRLSAADAAGVSRTTWLRLLEHLGRIQAPDSIGAWLATTAHDESLRVARLAGLEQPTGCDVDGCAPFGSACPGPYTWNQSV